jgi:acyl dehydratase
MKFLATAVVGILLVSGCTWVKPTPSGEQVRIVSSPAEIADCKKLGNTTVSLLDKVGYFKRDPKKVENELSILGRNSAAEMGGDTILPISEIYQGERSFEVYRCKGN